MNATFTENIRWRNSDCKRCVTINSLGKKRNKKYRENLIVIGFINVSQSTLVEE
jgi:hypothetical protein